MTRPFLLISSLVCICMSGVAQNEQSKSSEKLSPEQTKQVLSDIVAKNGKNFLSASSVKACGCIDSFMQERRTGDTTKITENVSRCIDNEVVNYQMATKLFQSLSASDQENKIVINTDTRSAEYKKYYTDIESWLMDSCSSLRQAMSSNDEKESDVSVSKDPEAVKQYNAALKFLNKEDYTAALPLFLKAVEIDPKFGFAWDNIGICYRRTGDLDNALIAYNKSLALNPKARTPLMNIPVVYEKKNDYKKALETYKNLLFYYPDDAEAYYGMGRICIVFIDDLENGVDYMCKAYNIYVKEKSPYRADAEKNLAYAYQKMKEQGKEETFLKILKNNNISTK